MLERDLAAYATIDDGSLHGTCASCCSSDQYDMATYPSIELDADTLQRQVSQSVCLSASLTHSHNANSH